jgi:hypothetical protein
MVIFQGILILQLVLQGYLDLILQQIFHFLIFHGILPNFGGDGIFHSLPGFGIMYIFRLAEAEDLNGK